jgi:hypothetical protein
VIGGLVDEAAVFDDVCGSRSFRETANRGEVVGGCLFQCEVVHNDEDEIFVYE